MARSSRRKLPTQKKTHRKQKEKKRGVSFPGTTGAFEMQPGVYLGKRYLIVAFESRQQLLERLIGSAQLLVSPRAERGLTRAHLSFVVKNVGVVGAEAETLGFERAFTIVVGCAFGETNLNKTLGELGIDLGLFHACVIEGAHSEGFVISPDEVPNSEDTTLFEVVVALAGARKEQA